MAGSVRSPIRVGMQPSVADRDEAGKALGDLHPCEALLARFGIAHDDTKAQRQSRDVGNGWPGPTASGVRTG